VLEALQEKHPGKSWVKAPAQGKKRKKQETKKTGVPYGSARY
jgi:hypothetical protein